MRKMIFAAAAALTIAVPGVAFAQDTSPDGSRAFGIEPYFGIMGGHEMFDHDTSGSNIPNQPNGRAYNSTMVEGVLGANVPLGPVFVGAEGSIAKGVKGDIDWQYGVAGRAGFRAGESGLIYGKAGYEWVKFDNPIPGNDHIGNPVYGVGVEVGPKDIGLGGVTGKSGVRLRLEADTNDFNSIRPMAGVVMHF